MWECQVCHTQNWSFGTACRQCSASRDGGGGFLVLIGWAFVFFVFPVYPIAGGLATLALIVSGFIGTATGLGPVVFIAVAIATYATLFLAFKYEQRAANNRLYRRLRDAIRILTGIGLFIALLDHMGKDPRASGGDGVAALIVLPIAFFLIKRLDRILGAAGPEIPKPLKETKPIDATAKPALAAGQQLGRAISRSAPEWIRTLNFLNAIALGFFGGVLGFLLGRGDPILSALVFWVLVTGAVLAWEIAGHLLRGGGKAVAGSIKLGGGLPFWTLAGGAIGAVIGATTGSGSYIDPGDVIGMAIICAPVGLLFGWLVRPKRKP